MARPEPVTWPEGRRFALTVFDDTDRTTVENGAPVYDALDAHGLKVTKSVWPVAPAGPPLVGGSTCAEPDYRRWVQDLQHRGHEIGYHNASDHSSTRAQTAAALDRFCELFGHDPRVGADHAANAEALYWGPRRLSGARSALYGAGQRLVSAEQRSFSGEDPASPYFWADLCRDRVTYWRNFTFQRVNLLEVCPVLPYHDPSRPYVNYWFASTHAPRRQPFVELLSDAALDRLEAQGGACILYTHFGVDFAPDGRLHPDVEACLARVARRPGWFAPVSAVLDHLRAAQPSSLLTDAARRRLENRWLADRLGHDLPARLRSRWTKRRSRR